MNELIRLAVLISEVEKGMAVLDRIEGFYLEFMRRRGVNPPRKTEDAIVIADVLVSYYTCLETLFVRVSQHFENSVSREKWHQDLLGKMTLEIQGVRERMISEQTAACLGELLRFRHFKRYYLEFDYDWDRLEYLHKKFEQVRPLLKADLAEFLGFLQRLASA